MTFAAVIWATAAMTLTGLAFGSIMLTCSHYIAQATVNKRASASLWYAYLIFALAGACWGIFASVL